MADVIPHLLSQRACRSFTDDQVADVHLEVMLEAATHAASAGISQPWTFGRPFAAPLFGS
ncbi:MAG: nitroreductase family protein [Acidimicrobiales bacterium]|nr:nitroreductase family protein [Acidimicrobiales bacterium]